MVIQTDASTLGWGAVYGNQEVAGGGGGGGDGQLLKAVST